MILAKLGGIMPPSRLEHTLGVEISALSIAQVVGEDADTVALAALLHDCAKCLSMPDMLRLIDGGGMPIDRITRDNRSLLHAPAGAVLARDEYNVTDPRIIEAIRWHTTGRANIGRLGALIYLADVVEPYREDYPGLGAVRDSMGGDLNHALLLAVRDTIEYVRGRQKPIHPDSLALRDWLEAGGRPFDGQIME